jgi:glutathione peroxidase-family protein
MIEFTRFDNPLYQQQYEQVVALYQVYRNYGLKVITVPIGANDVVFNAFFEERGMFWDVADPESFYAEELRIQYNLNRLPTRFLVNSQGNIVQRYEGTEFDRIIQGLQKTLTQQQTES